MQGLIEEGNDVIAAVDGKIVESADLALIAAAQKVEHYEISSYVTPAIWPNRRNSLRWRSC